MAVKVLKLYSVQIWDGGSHQNHEFYLTSKEEADRWLAANNCDWVSEETIEVFDTIEDWQDWSKGNNIKEQALAKLTPEERKVLGF